MDTDEPDVRALINHGWQGMPDIEALIVIRRAGVRSEQLSRSLSEVMRLADIRRLTPCHGVRESIQCAT